MIDLTSPSVGIDRITGSPITGWAHVEQSLADIFTTTFGERIMREWYGSAVPNLLGRLATDQEILPFFAAVCSAIEQWEPRYRVVKVHILGVTRAGALDFALDGEYRPRAMLGDFTPEGARRVRAYAGAEGIAVGEAP